MGEIDPKLVERMVALVRELGRPGGIVRADKFGNMLNVCDEARAIVAELPEPVDPDLVLAREVAQQTQCPGGEEYIGGFADVSDAVVNALAAIKRVRGDA